VKHQKLQDSAYQLHSHHSAQASDDSDGVEEGAQEPVRPSVVQNNTLKEIPAIR
jgi:hypothetical protein